MITNKEKLEAWRKAAIKAHHGRKIVVPNTAPIYPAAVERQYRNLADEYFRHVKRIFLKYWNPAREALSSRMDDVNDRDFISIIRMAFDDMEVELTNVLNQFGLRKRIMRVAQRLNLHSAEEFFRLMESIGIDITKDRYMGDYYQTMLENWVRDNVALITTLPHQTLYTMRKIAMDGFLVGKSIVTITKEIQEQYGMGRRHARLIARDQTGKLYAKINQSRQEAAGVKEYIWICCMDGRERDAHRELHKTKHSWDNPPIVDKKTGRRCHPGEDYQCRCRAKPVIDLSMLDP